MAVPVAGRSLAAVAGGWVTRWTDRIVDWAFIVAVGAGDDYLRRERVRVAQGVTLLIVQFLAWLGSSFIGFSLLLWPFVAGGITQALTMRGRYALVLPAGPGAARLGYGDMSGARPERGGSGRAGRECDHRGPASRPWLRGRGRQAGTVLVRSAGSGRPER